MKTNHVKHKLAEGGVVLGTCLTDYVSAEAPALISAAGLDFFFVDTEHAPTTYRDIQTLVRAAKQFDVTVLVRVTQAEYPLIARALDCGAMGIIAPRTQSVEEAQSIVSAMKFPPKGNRGYGLRSIVTDMDFQGAENEMASSDGESLCIVQMETQSCVDQIEEIVAVDGVDATMVGPFDLSVSLGIPGQFDSPIFWKAFDKMVAACDKAGVAPGVHFGNAELLQRAKDHGARFLVFGTDVSILLAGWKQARASFELTPAATPAGGGYL